MASLGQELRRERELRGIPLQEISSSTKISLKFLKALEDDRLELLPGKFLTRGIIRAYSKCVGLDEDHVLNKYIETTVYQEQNEPEKQINKVLLSKPDSKRKSWPIVVIIILVPVITLSAFFTLRNWKAPKAGEKIQVPTSLQSENVIPPTIKELVEEVPKELSIELSFTETTWIQLYADNTLVLDGLIQAGEQFKTVASGELVFNLGNAGGIAYSLNGKKGIALGRSGEVVKNIKITLDNHKDFLAREQEATDERR